MVYNFTLYKLDKIGDLRPTFLASCNQIFISSIFIFVPPLKSIPLFKKKPLENIISWLSLV